MICGDRKMTAKRAGDFSHYYDEVKLPKKQAQVTAREHFDKLDKEIFNSVLVTATPISATGDLRPWARTLGSLCKPDENGQLWDLACSCPVFAAGANRCVHVVACAGHLKFIDIPLLLTNMDGGVVATARPSGRLAEVEENCLTKIVPNKGRIVEDWLKIILSKHPADYFFANVWIKATFKGMSQYHGGFVADCQIVDNDRVYVVTVVGHGHARLNPAQFAVVFQARAKKMPFRYSRAIKTIPAVFDHDCMKAAGP